MGFIFICFLLKAHIFRFLEKKVTFGLEIVGKRAFFGIVGYVQVVFRGPFHCHFAEQKDCCLTKFYSSFLGSGKMQRNLIAN